MCTSSETFHIVQLAGRALDSLRRAEWQQSREQDPARAKWLKGTGFLLRRRADTLSTRQCGVHEALEHTNREVYHGWLLADHLKAVYAARDHDEAMDLLDEWILSAATSELEPFITVAITFASLRGDRQRRRAGQEQRSPGGHELDRAAHQPPRPRLSQPLLAARPQLRAHPRPATHLNARRGENRARSGRGSVLPSPAQRQPDG